MTVCSVPRLARPVFSSYQSTLTKRSADATLRTLPSHTMPRSLRVRVDVPLLFNARQNQVRWSSTNSNFRWLTVFSSVLPFYDEHPARRNTACTPRTILAKRATSKVSTLVSETIAVTSTNTPRNTIHRDIEPRSRQLAISYFVGRPGSFRADGHERTPSRCRIPLIFVRFRTIRCLTISSCGLIFGRPGWKIATHAFWISMPKSIRFVCWTVPRRSCAVFPNRNATQQRQFRLRGKSRVRARDERLAARYRTDRMFRSDVERTLDVEYRRRCIGSPFAFTVPAANVASSGSALKRHL